MMIMEHEAIIEYIYPRDPLGAIEAAARTCYRSEDRVGPGSAERLVRSLIDRGHEAMLEFAGATVRVKTDRGVANEWVRHRIASFAQESTRYCTYDQLGLMVRPYLDGLSVEQKQARFELYGHAERVYRAEIAAGVKPQQARDNLPVCTATELVMSANMREWRHVLRQRTSPKAHPMMVRLMTGLLHDFRAAVPIVFDDLEVAC